MPESCWQLTLPHWASVSAIFVTAMDRLQNKMEHGPFGHQQTSWLYHYLAEPKWRMANMVQHLPHGALADKVLDKVNEQFDALSPGKMHGN